MKLESIEKQNIFKLPEGYFENLPTEIQARITHLGGNIFITPQGYFESLPTEIQARISPTLPAGKAEDVLQVPNDYFENLQHNILRRVNASKAKPAPVWGRQAIRFATVGLSALLLGVAVWYALPAGKVGKEESAQNLPKTEEKTVSQTPKQAKATEKEENKDNTNETTPQKETPSIAQNTNLAYTPTSVASKQENTLVHLLAKTDEATEEALSTLVDSEHEDAAGNEEEEEWHEAHEETLHKITEEQIKALPKLLKK